MRTLLALICIVFLLNLSCNKSDEAEPTHQNILTVTLNGEAFKPRKINVVDNGSTTPGARSISIYAEDGAKRVVSLHMYDYDGLKDTFKLQQNATMGIFCLQFCSTYQGVLTVSNSGELLIASFDTVTYRGGNVITGTFNFETDNYVGKYSATNGRFSVFVPN